MKLFAKEKEWELERCLLAQIEEEEQQALAPSGHRFHIRRYLESFRWLPKKPGLVLDLGGACGLFSRLLSEFSSHTLFHADHLASEASAQFDFEKDAFPFPDEHFDIVLFMEVLEHLKEDPMHALAEINRVLKPQGALLLTTPNIASWKSARRLLQGNHPGLFVQYMRHGGSDRHNREYTATEVHQLVQHAGMEPERFDALDVYDHVPGAEAISEWPQAWRGDTVFCLARKTRGVRDRYPQWLYWPEKA